MTQNKIEHAMYMAAIVDTYTVYRNRVAVVRELWPGWEWFICKLELPMDCFLGVENSFYNDVGTGNRHEYTRIRHNASQR